MTDAREWICSFADKQLKFMLNLGLSLYSYAVCFCHRSGAIGRYFKVYIAGFQCHAIQNR